MSHKSISKMIQVQRKSRIWYSAQNASVKFPLHGALKCDPLGSKSFALHTMCALTHTQKEMQLTSMYQCISRVIIRIITQISYTQNVGHLHTLPSTETKYESQPWSLPAISEAPYSEVCCLGFGEMKGYYKCNILYTKVKGHRNSTKIWILICIYIIIIIYTE